jgi:ABC-2 type transport system ATP-binding protein
LSIASVSIRVFSRSAAGEAQDCALSLTLIQPKGPTSVNKTLVDVPPGGIWVCRFTAPKYLSSMVAMTKVRMGVMKSEQSALQVRGLTKRFDRLAVDALDLTVRAGEYYALVGPNGAGKTTTLRMVAGLLKPDAGSVAIFGIDALGDPVAAKQVMAWVSDEPMIYDKLTPLEYLEFVAGLWGIDPAVSQKSAHELLASLGLEPHLDERCEGFSKGMRQKVALAGALVHEPRLIILDEPLTGLDAVSARHVKGLLANRVRAGCTVIMTTHILEVAERMADRIGVIAAGRLVAEGTLAELRQQNGHTDISLEDLFIALVDVEAAAA